MCIETAMEASIPNSAGLQQAGAKPTLKVGMKKAPAHEE